MARHYKYITFSDRREIAALYQANARPADIAERLGVTTATIYRELKRGESVGEDGAPVLDRNRRRAYNPVVAQQRVQANFRRRGSHDPEDNFQLDYVLVKGSKATPDAAIAYAHYLDELISFNPFESNGDVKRIGDWAFSFDSDLFMYLEQGYELAGASALTHCVVWEEIEEYHGDGGINYPKGMQQYLNYCKKNGVTVELLRKEHSYGGMDVMKLYDKSAFKEKSPQEQER